MTAAFILNQKLLQQLFHEDNIEGVLYHQDSVVLKGNPLDDSMNYVGSLFIIQRRPVGRKRFLPAPVPQPSYVVWLSYSFLYCLASHLLSTKARKIIDVEEQNLQQLSQLTSLMKGGEIAEEKAAASAYEESPLQERQEWHHTICIALSQIRSVLHKSNLRGRRIITLVRKSFLEGDNNYSISSVGGETAPQLIFEDGGVAKFFEALKKLCNVRQSPQADEFILSDEVVSLSHVYTPKLVTPKHVSISSAVSAGQQQLKSAAVSTGLTGVVRSNERDPLSPNSISDDNDWLRVDNSMRKQLYSTVLGGEKYPNSNKKLSRAVDVMINFGANLTKGAKAIIRDDDDMRGSGGEGGIGYISRITKRNQQELLINDSFEDLSGSASQLESEDTFEMIEAVSQNENISPTLNVGTVKRMSSPLSRLDWNACFDDCTIATTINSVTVNVEGETKQQPSLSSKSVISPNAATEKKSAVNNDYHDSSNNYLIAVDVKTFSSELPSLASLNVNATTTPKMRPSTISRFGAATPPFLVAVESIDPKDLPPCRYGDKGTINSEDLFFKVRVKAYNGGISDEIRANVWLYLLNVFPLGSTELQRRVIVERCRREYEILKMQWQSIFPAQEEHFGAFHQHRVAVEKDVLRTDRNHPDFKDDESEKLKQLRSILLSYAMYNFDLGYCQGMSDILAVILIVYPDDEVMAFAVFRQLLAIKLGENFRNDVMRNMEKQLKDVQVLVKRFVPNFYAHLERNHADSMTFCFRWLLILFKREFEMKNVIKLWDVIFASPYTPQYEIFVTTAILRNVAPRILAHQLSYDEILKYVNSMAYQFDVSDVILLAHEFYDMVTTKYAESKLVQQDISLNNNFYCTNNSISITSSYNSVHPKLSNLLRMIELEEAEKNTKATTMHQHQSYGNSNNGNATKVLSSMSSFPDSLSAIIGFT